MRPKLVKPAKPKAGRPKLVRPTEPVMRVVDRVGPNAVRKHFGLKTVHSIYKWMKRGLPDNRVRKFHALARHNGVQVTLSELRPDLYGP